MKSVILVLLFAALPAPLSIAESAPWCLYDHSNPSLIRIGNVRLASKIEVSDYSVKLLAESGEKLIPFYDSKDPRAIAQTRARIQMAPNVCIPVAGGAYVLTDSIASVEIVQRNNTAAYVLRGLAVELGVVVEDDGIRRLKAALSLP